MSFVERGTSAMRLAVIGAGRSGRSFALLCLERGHHVTLEDVMPAKLRSAATEFQEFAAPENLARLNLVTTVEDAVRDADIVVDFVPDELESKLEIFSMVDRMAPPHTILLTPSDAVSIADLASCTYRPHLCFSLRGLSAVADSPSVELLHPAGADPAATAAVQSLLASLDLPARLLLDQMPSMLTGR